MRIMYGQTALFDPFGQRNLLSGLISKIQEALLSS